MREITRIDEYHWGVQAQVWFDAAGMVDLNDPSLKAFNLDLGDRAGRATLRFEEKGAWEAFKKTATISPFCVTCVHVNPMRRRGTGYLDGLHFDILSGHIPLRPAPKSKEPEELNCPDYVYFPEPPDDLEP